VDGKPPPVDQLECYGELEFLELVVDETGLVVQLIVQPRRLRRSRSDELYTMLVFDGERWLFYPVVPNVGRIK
jgi:hypothetical protein